MVNALFTIDGITAPSAAAPRATDGDDDLGDPSTIEGFNLVVAFFLRVIRALASLPHTCVHARNLAMLDMRAKVQIFKSKKTCSHPPSSALGCGCSISCVSDLISGLQ
jgi:hypothetical protein